MTEDLIDQITNEINALPGVEVSTVVDDDPFMIFMSVDIDEDGAWGSIEVLTALASAASPEEGESHVTLECLWDAEYECVDFTLVGTNVDRESFPEMIKHTWGERIAAWEDREQYEEENPWPISQRVGSKSLEDALYLLDTFGREWVDSLQEFFTKAAEDELSQAEGMLLARTFFWEMENGERVPEGHWLRHECGTGHCVNPDHAVLVPIGE